jgi:cytosine/uracil/thiamine/allantoin permease
VLVFAAAGVPIYLCIKLDGHLKLLTGILACFVIIHGIYHALDVFGYSELGGRLFEPLSIAILISFGIMYWHIRKKKEVVAST